MKTLKREQSGFGTVELVLIVIIICLIGVVGWLVYKNKHQSPPKTVTITKTVVAKPSASTKTTPQSVVKIPELGIRLVNVPDSIKDLTYSVASTSADQNYKAVWFTTSSLAKLDDKCGIGGLNKYPGTYNTATDQFPLTAFAKQFDGFWIASTRTGVPCGEAGTASFNLQYQQIQAYSQFVKESSNIQLSN